MAKEEKPPVTPESAPADAPESHEARCKRELKEQEAAHQERVKAWKAHDEEVAKSAAKGGKNG